jgi:polysaccharide biosynthesis transport protein
LTQPQYELNLRDYLRIFKKRKLIIFSCVLIFSFIGIWYMSNQEPVYQATTTVKIEERRTVSGLLTEWIVYNPADVLESQAKIIKGFPVLQAAAFELGLVSEDAFEAQIHQAVREIDSKLEAEQIGNTNILKITTTTADPLEAMVLANTIAHVYVEQNLLDKNKQARIVREFIQNQLGELENRMRASEEELKVFSQQTKNIKVAEPIQRKLTDLEFELASLSQKYTTKHPRIIQLKEEIKSLQGQVKGISGEEMEYARLQREVEVDRKLYAMLKEKLEQARITEAEKVADVSIVNPAIMPQGPINATGSLGIILGAFLGLILGSVLAFVAETADTSIGTVEDVEAITGLPMLGVVPSVSDELYGKRTLFSGLKQIFAPKQMSEEDENYVRLLVHHRPTSPASEAFRNIRTNLKISPTNKTFLVTSSNPKEGKTTIVTNLALAVAQESLKVLIISSDMRRAQIARSFGIEREPGLSEILQGTIPLEKGMRNITDVMLGGIDIDETLASSGLRNIWIIPAGIYPPNAAELLASRDLGLITNKLKGDFDCIIFDSPPILPVTDAAIIAPLVDGVIICYEIGKTSRSALLRTKSQLESVNATIKGIVLNHTKPETEPLDPYPYYYRYKNRYYREDLNQKEAKIT